MRVIRSAAEMQKTALQARREGKSIGFVPTMGCLHEGHISLIRRARAEADLVVVSIFVNPLQFGPREDLATYPRDFESDLELCRQQMVDIVFAPSEAEMYSSEFSTYVEETVLSRGLCGRFRPGHFRGVTTVVAKLFNLVLPDVAIFGEKDAQQARVIRRITRDLNFPVRILTLPTVREPDGLALSSRNRRLSAEERQRAATIYQALAAARELANAGERNARVLEQEVRSRLEKAGLKVEYVEVVDEASLESVETVNRPVILAVAVKVGTTRLIDNIQLDP
ncbi:MAG: pantoate--beta-alanine ligase [Kiritimatiellia bacterium]